VEHQKLFAVTMSNSELLSNTEKFLRDRPTVPCSHGRINPVTTFSGGKNCDSSLLCWDHWCCFGTVC